MRTAALLLGAALLLAASAAPSASRPAESAIEDAGPACPFLDARPIASHSETRVGVDNATALAAMALAAATNETLSLQDLTETRSVMVLTCAIRLSINGVLLARAEVTLVTACEHSVRLPDSLALGAIAMARSGIPVHVHDVLTERTSCATKLIHSREFRIADLEPSS